MSLSSAAAEMAAVAAQNTRVKDAVYHVILSWPTGESPTDEQAFACGAHALHAVGMAEHQYVFGIHRDTDNVHLHISVNRVHPETYRAVYPDRDYFKLDRAMRELELHYGWHHDNGPYAVFERDGKKVIDWSSKDPNSKGKRPTGAADMERHGDQESLFSYARGEPRKALLRALKDDKLTWQQLHTLLSKYGLSLREKGQGFAIYDSSSEGIVPIKASDMHESLSKARLVKRLGPFIVAAPPASPDTTYNKHRSPKRNPQQREERRQERAQARKELRERYKEYKDGFIYRRLDAEEVRRRYAVIRDDARQRRLEVKTTISDPAARKAMYSVIAFETLRAKDRLRREIRNERAALRKDPANCRQSFREWVERQAAGGDAAAISQLRGYAYAEKRRAKELDRSLDNTQADGIVHTDEVDPIARDLGTDMHFRVRRDGTVIYRTKDGQDGFLDLGRRIDVLAKDQQQRDAMASALLFAAEKYGGTFALTGSDDFKKLAIDIIAERKIHVKLQDVADDAWLRARIGELEKEARGKVHKRTPGR